MFIDAKKGPHDLFFKKKVLIQWVSPGFTKPKINEQTMAMFLAVLQTHHENTEIPRKQETSTKIIKTSKNPEKIPQSECHPSAEESFSVMFLECDSHSANGP